MKHKKIVFANLNAFSCNKGCMALGESTLAIFDHILVSNGYSYDFYLTDSELEEGEHTLHIGSQDIKITTVQSFQFKLTSFAKSLVKGNFFRYLKIIKDADIIFNIGHGDSFSDIYGVNRFKDIDRIHRIARLFRKSYVFLPQTIGPFKDKKVERKAQKSLINSKCVLCRDIQSAKYTESLVGDSTKVHETIDVAFALPYTCDNKTNVDINIGLNISSLLYNGGYTKSNEFGIKDNYKKLIDEIIIMFLKMKNVRIHLLPHVVHERPIVENDYYVCSMIAKKYNDNRIIISPFFFSASEAKSYISGLDFFIGSRMHATIGAFSSGVPVVPLGYSRKFNGLFLQTLNYEWLCDLTTTDNQTALKTILNAYENRIQIKRDIRNRMDNIVCSKLTSLNTIIFNILNL